MVLYCPAYSAYSAPDRYKGIKTEPRGDKTIPASPKSSQAATTPDTQTKIAQRTLSRETQRQPRHHRGIGRAIELPYRALFNIFFMNINIFFINICRFKYYMFNI